MHTYLITRGIMSSRDTWVKSMQAQMANWSRINLTTKEKEYTSVQVALRPIELWECVFPKEFLPEFLAMQRRADGGGSLINEKELRPEIKNYALLMQKLLKLKPIPSFPDYKPMGYIPEAGAPPMPVHWVPTDGFAVYPIGIKEDAEQDFPQWNYRQEAL